MGGHYKCMHTRLVMIFRIDGWHDDMTIYIYDIPFSKHLVINAKRVWFIAVMSKEFELHAPHPRLSMPRKQPAQSQLNANAMTNPLNPQQPT